MDILEPILNSVQFQMSLLMFVALGGYLLAYRIRQPSSIGLVIGGVLVGPSLLGLVTYTDFVSSLAKLGAVVLLFTIGLEFEIEEIIKPKYLLIALFGVLVPWLAGWALTEAFGYGFQISLFVGTAITATSIAMTASVLQELGKLQTEAARAILGAAIIDDVLALLAFSISEEMFGGTLSTLQVLGGFGKAIAFIVIAAIPVRSLLRRLTLRLDATPMAAKFPESMFVFAMMIAFLFGIAAELVGLSAVVGSFLAGVCFTGDILKRVDIFETGSQHLKVIFGSIFFISLGVLLDLRVMTLPLLWFALALTAAAVLAKYAGCGVTARFLGFKGRDWQIIGVGMVPRGEVAMVVSLIGLSRGYIEEDVYSALILMSLLTTVIVPFVLRGWLYRTPHVKNHQLTTDN